MANAMSIQAVYEHGLLRPLQPLFLPERAQVYVIVVPSEPQQPPVEERLRQMHARADEWLANQPRDAVRAPRPLSPTTRAKLDAELGRLLAEVDASMGDVPDETITALVNEAAHAVRHGA